MVVLCAVCKRNLVEVEDNSTEERCVNCIDNTQIPSDIMARVILANTVRFRVGDIVECRTAGVLYDGVGEILWVSTDLKDGGTPVYPAFRVALRDKAYEGVPDEVTYTECCLTRSG